MHWVRADKVCGHRFAGLADPADRRPQFLGPPATDGRRFDRQHDALHPRVGGRLVEPLDEAVQVRRHISQEPALADAVGDRSRQRDLGDHRRLLLGLLLGGLAVLGVFVDRLAHLARWFGGRRLPVHGRRMHRGRSQQQDRQTASTGNTGTADSPDRARKAEKVMHGGATPKKIDQRT